MADKAAARPRLVDEYLAKVEEWVERSKGKVRADVAHEKLLALGYTGSERTTRRAVAAVRKADRAGRVRVHRPWVTEPGMWAQYDFGDGPVVGGAKTTLFCVWPAWSRFRVASPLADKTLPSVFAALDACFRRMGGAPTYVLTDNERTVTVEHIAGVPVRNRQMVAFASHYSVVVPTEANLGAEYASFAELETACEAFCDKVDTRTHRSTRRRPVDMLAEEVAGRDRSSLATRRAAAGFPTGKTFDAWQPDASSIPLPTQHALRTLEWVHRRENLVVCGPSGTGKTFLLEALGQQAVQTGLRVAWFSLEGLGVLLRRHSADDTVSKAIAKVLRADLVIIDDIGLLPVASDAAEGLYRLIDAAYEKRSVALSSNLHPSGFDELMPKTLATATATVDRLLHHAHVCQTSGDSVRLTQALAGQGVSPLT